MQLPPCQRAHTDVSAGSAAVGIFLVAATTLASLPQLCLLLRTRSSAGLSMLTPALALSYGGFNLIATTILKWPALRSCSHTAGCFLQLLDFLQQAASALGLAAILLLVVALPPNADRTRRAAAIATLVFLAGVGAAACIVSAHEACSTGARSFALVASVCSQTLVVVAFAPQLVETWRTQGRGSLSYTYYTIMTVGSLAVVFFQAFGLGDSWAVWAPPLVGAVMQGAVLGVGAFFLCCRRTRLSSSATEPMLDAEQPVVNHEAVAATTAGGSTRQ